VEGQLGCPENYSRFTGDSECRGQNKFPSKRLEVLFWSITLIADPAAAHVPEAGLGPSSAWPTLSWPRGDIQHDYIRLQFGNFPQDRCSVDESTADGEFVRSHFTTTAQ
jgi:hypothetical protein